MQLLVIRHAIAEDREAFTETGRDDDERPLTKQGKRQMKRIAKGLRRVVKSIDVLSASSLVRAAQTAAIVAEEYGDLPVITVAALAPESAPEAFAAWLGRQRIADVVGAVGHDPHLGMLVTWLLSARTDSRVMLDKGGACLLELAGAPRAGSATLRWALTPQMLVRLGD